MTRYPNPKAKIVQVVLKAKPEWEIEVRAFREICARNGIEMGRELYERGIRTFLRDHNWPPGNSQTVLPAFSENKSEPPVAAAKCGFTNCDRKCEMVVVHESGYEMPVCSYHIDMFADEPKWRIKT